MAELQANSTMNGELLITNPALLTFNKRWHLKEAIKIQAYDKNTNDYFGWSVAISGNSSKILSGSIRDDPKGSNSGSAYIYTFNGSWNIDQKITALDGATDDEFGDSVSISDDGLTCIIGSFSNVGGTDAGGVYVYERQGNIWLQVQKLEASDKEASDFFGSNVHISGNGLTCIIGAHGEDTNGVDAGAVYIFENTAGTWSEVAKLTGSDTQAGDWFGRGVNLSYDGSVCIVGAQTHNGHGAAYIFENLSGTWTEKTKLLASDIEADDNFGYLTSISNDGLTCIVSALSEDTGGASTGAVYIYENLNGTWIEVQKIQASDKESGDNFGRSIDISGDGLTIAVGAIFEDANDHGAGYIFEKQDNTWIQTAKIKASDHQATDYLGISVSLSNDGLICVISAPYEDTGGSNAGAIYVYRKY